MALCLALVLAPAASAAARDVFTVAAVPVDATAASALAAREQARADGEQQAFRILFDRLTPAAEHGRLPHLGGTALENLIASFEVQKERHSGVRYLADYTYHFRASAVRQLLRRSGIAFVETPGKPLLVLPVLDQPSGPALWEDPNPWRDAWNHHPPPEGLVPLVVPVGGLEDVAAIDAAAAEKGDDSRLQAISGRYDNDNVLVTRATLKSAAAPHGVDVTSIVYTPGQPGGEQAHTASYAAKPGESDADLLADAVAGTADQVEDIWKTANMLDAGHGAGGGGGTLVATVPVPDLESWIAVRDRLAQIPAVRSSTLVSLDRSGARVSIHYAGDMTQLRAALAQRDLQLSGADPDWVLERGSAAAAVPPPPPPPQ